MKGRVTLLFLAVLLLFGGCGRETGKEESPYVLYFCSTADQGPALATQPYRGAERPSPESLLTALLAGPDQEELSSPFPPRVTLVHWEWDEETPGLLKVWLSEQYGGLTDISLTLADYCIVLTLSQLKGVETVEILTWGSSTSYRSHQVLMAEEVLLTDEAAGGTAFP